MKRLVALPLWFFSSAGVYFVFADFTGTPRVIGLLFAALVAALVIVDPVHLFWPASSRREYASTSTNRIGSEARRPI